jgi:protein-disulfide isomerase
MIIREWTVVLGFLLSFGLPGRIAWAQQQSTPEELKREIEALKAEMKAVQKDLQEIKTLLAPLRAQQPPQPQNVVLDLGNRPFRGERTARLTLVEFTDYQ